MANVNLETILKATCDWCPLAYCVEDDCGVKAIRDTYIVRNHIVDLKED